MFEERVIIVKQQRMVMMADMQSFYCSVEKAHHPEYRNRPLIVAGSPERRTGIVLAACPLAKKMGIGTADLLHEALAKCPDVVVMPPRMETYIQVSLQIAEILSDFSDLVECYSIDELFIDITNTAHLFGSDPEGIAKQIQSRIWLETGVFARVGCADTKVKAKLTVDLICKKSESGIFVLKKGDMEKYIHSHPVESMWGVGSQYRRHLNRMGIWTIGNLSKYSLTRLRKKWGVNGEVLWRVANGIDDSPVSLDTFTEQKNIGNGLTLPKDYCKADEIETALLDIISIVCKRAREKGLMGQVVSIGVRGHVWETPTGFSRQKKLTRPTYLTKEVFREAKGLFYQYWDGLPIRRIYVELSDLQKDDIVQLDLFDQADRERQLQLERVTDYIHDQFGVTSLLRASSLTSGGVALDRADRIGGHLK
ncbi:DNA polymerase IV [Paenibacillus larvae]|nr:DNA polymerase IV [Paenibacillus larvae]MCY9500379.1 DNA polymerase IV [Paenibacillus larvae]MDR5608789.1 DNA polymerase IV [Paenibacillus larvae]